MIVKVCTETGLTAPIIDLTQVPSSPSLNQISAGFVLGFDAGHIVDLIGAQTTSASFQVEVITYEDNYILCDEIEIRPPNAAIRLYPTNFPQRPGKVYADGLQPETCYTLTTICCDLYRDSPYIKTGQDCYKGSKDFCTGNFVSIIKAIICLVFKVKPHFRDLNLNKTFNISWCKYSCF